MKSNKRLIAVLGIGFIVCMTLALGDWGVVSAQECRIIRLFGTAHPTTTINIEPRIVRIEKGGCVVWSNWIREAEVQIVFEDGKKCEDMTDAATGFKLDAYNCYVTSFVTLGGTSSLRFNEAGRFYYEVKAGGGVREIGKIVVK
jgi:hypothetical protein